MSLACSQNYLGTYCIKYSKFYFVLKMSIVSSCVFHEGWSLGTPVTTTSPPRQLLNLMFAFQTLLYLISFKHCIGYHLYKVLYSPLTSRCLLLNLSFLTFFLNLFSWQPLHLWISSP